MGFRLLTLSASRCGVTGGTLEIEFGGLTPGTGTAKEVGIECH